MPGAQQARLSYRRIGVPAGHSLLEVTLETGRKHQIRLQLAERGHPILGDPYAVGQGFGAVYLDRLGLRIPLLLVPLPPPPLISLSLLTHQYAGEP